MPEFASGPMATTSTSPGRARTVSARKSAAFRSSRTGSVCRSSKQVPSWPGHHTSLPDKVSAAPGTTVGGVAGEGGEAVGEPGAQQGVAVDGGDAGQVGFGRAREDAERQGVVDVAADVGVEDQDAGAGVVCGHVRLRGR